MIKEDKITITETVVTLQSGYLRFACDVKPDMDFMDVVVADKVFFRTFSEDRESSVVLNESDIRRLVEVLSKWIGE